MRAGIREDGKLEKTVHEELPDQAIIGPFKPRLRHDVARLAALAPIGELVWDLGRLETVWKRLPWDLRVGHVSAWPPELG